MKIFFCAITLLFVCACSRPDPIILTIPNPDPDALANVFGVEELPPASSDEPPTSGGESTPVLSAFGVIDVPTGGVDSIPGFELVGDFNYVPIQRDDISIQITSFGFIDSGQPRVTMRLDNQSNDVIRGALCSIEVVQRGENVGTGKSRFANMGFIDPNESAVDIVFFFDEFSEGFNSFDELQLTCVWETVDTRLDLSNGDERVEFIELGISDAGFATVALRRTNNSTQLAPNMVCFVPVQLGDVIVDAAFMIFAELGAGGTQESFGELQYFQSLQAFSDEAFSYSEFDCAPFG